MRALVFSAMMKRMKWPENGPLNDREAVWGFAWFAAYLCAGGVLAVLLSGCAGPERIVTKEVKVPVPVKAEAPDWLMAGYKPEAIPEFVSPDDPRASSALTPEGEKALRLIIIDLTGRDDAWREWAR